MTAGTLYIVEHPPEKEIEGNYRRQWDDVWQDVLNSFERADENTVAFQVLKKSMDHSNADEFELLRGWVRLTLGSEPQFPYGVLEYAEIEEDRYHRTIKANLEALHDIKIHTRPRPTREDIAKSRVRTLPEAAKSARALLPKTLKPLRLPAKH